jgi:rRNA processing protein Gar1
MISDSELAREKMWSRIYLIPALTAESDRDLVRRHYADLAREKELLGSNTKVYNSDKYVGSLAGLIGNVTSLYVVIHGLILR